MKKVDLKEESPRLEELLNMARTDSVLVFSKDGSTYVLEQADPFDQEVAELGQSKKFMDFLKLRSNDPAVISLEQFSHELAERDSNR